MLTCDREALVLLTDAGVVRVEHRGPACQSGDFVSVSASGQGPLEVLWRHPTGDFPPPGSEALHFLRSPRWENLRRRAAVIQATRRFFDDAGFLEIETPTLVRSPGTETHLDAFAVEVPGYPDRRGYLRTSPELHMKRLLSAGAGPIYQLAKVFRAGEHGAQHRPEFTMLEWYRPFANYDRLMDDCEQLFRAIGVEDTLEYQGKTLDMRRPWSRITYAEAIATYAPSDPVSYDDPEALVQLFVDKVEPHLGRNAPVFLTEFPICLGSLARAKPSDATVAERVELFIGGLELANGFGELTDAVEQQRRCEAENAERARTGRPIYPIDAPFIEALRQGLPPSAGIALGVDRLVMLALDLGDMGDVVAF